MQRAAHQKMSEIALIVNGERKLVHARSPRELLLELELEGSFFAIAVNRRVIPRARWDESALKNGDEIEIVTPRQGG